MIMYIKGELLEGFVLYIEESVKVTLYRKIEKQRAYQKKYSLLVGIT